MNNDSKDVELDGAEIFSNWSQLTSNPTATKDTSDVLEMSLDNLALEGGDTYWLERFQKTNLADMDLVALKLLPNPATDNLTEATQMKIQSKIFLQLLPEKYANQLRIAGLSEEQIGALKLGHTPINWTVHLKYPLAYGGTITVDNLVLIPHHPYHEELHHFINLQIITDAGIMRPPVLYIPTPKSAVYVPFGSTDMAKSVVHFNQGGLK